MKSRFKQEQEENFVQAIVKIIGYTVFAGIVVTLLWVLFNITFSAV